MITKESLSKITMRGNELHSQILQKQREIEDLTEELKILAELIQEEAKWKNLFNKKTPEREALDRYKRLHWDAFKEKTDKHGFYIFSFDGCELCKKYLLDINDSSIYENTTVVEIVLKEDEELAREIIPGFKALPYTALYLDNVFIDSRDGQLFEEQLNELKQSFIAGEKVEKDEYEDL